MSEAIKLILSLSVSGGLFAFVLLALKPLMRNRLSKSFQYYIWLVVLLRFILPFSFGINLIEYAPAGTPPSVETVNSENAANQAGEKVILENPANPKERDYTIPYTPGDNVPKGAFMEIDPLKILAENLLWIWFAGAVISAAWNILGYLRFIRYVHGAAYALEMPDCNVKVYKSRFAPTPMLVGVMKPRIYLPNIEYTDGQLKNILLHEITHLRRHDVCLKWFAALCVSVHWFNPIAYLMRREFNRACELSCDEAIIRKLDGAEKQSYGDTLISVVAESHNPVGVMSVTMCEEKKKLKERLVAIMNYKKKTKVAVFITAILAVTLTGCALAFGANFGAKGNDLIEMEIIYSNVTEYSHSEQIKWGERTYSPSSDYQDGFIVGKQIGFIRDETGYKYKIYECEGLSMDRYIVAYYDVIMSTYDLFAADANYLTLAEVEKMNGQPQSTVRKYLGEANGVLSGFWGDIYELADGKQAILYYGSDSYVENIVINTNALTPQITLHEYDGNPDIALGKTLTKEETGWVRLAGMVFIEVKVPDGAMTVQTYYAEAGTEVTAHQMLDNKYSAPFKNPSVPNEHSIGNSFNVADYYPDGFLGHIWAVITDADGVEHSSVIINVIYEPDNSQKQSSYPQGANGIFAEYRTEMTSDTEGWFIGNYGVAMGRQESYVYLTHDGGKTWQETDNVNDEWARVLTCGGFANDKIGFLCFRYDIENMGRIYRTEDGGRTWKQLDIPLLNELVCNGVGEVRKISFSNGQANSIVNIEYYSRSNDTYDEGSLHWISSFGEPDKWNSNEWYLTVSANQYDDA